jgi:hypothetical protein
MYLANVFALFAVGALAAPKPIMPRQVNGDLYIELFDVLDCTMSKPGKCCFPLVNRGRPYR